MELRQLTTFRSLARNLNFSRTADELNYAQSTVSAQIQSLEQELDVPLFDRLGKRIVLTDAGHQLLEYADKFLVLEKEIRANLCGAEVITGEITIYSPGTLCVYRLPQILRTYRQRYPQVHLNIYANITHSAVEQLRRGLVDIAFDLDEPISSIDMMSQTLMIEPMTFVVCPDHPLAAQKTFTIADLEGQSLVLTEPNCNYRVLLGKIAAEQGIPLENPMGFENVEAIKQCVKVGLGLSFLPRVAVADEIESGALVELPWQGKPIEFATQMIWHKDKWLSPGLKYLIEVAKELYC